MSEGEAIVCALQPPSKRLYESSKLLASCLKSHQEGKIHAEEETGTATENSANDGGKPTLAAMTRHFRLGQLLRAIAPLVVLQERLYRRLQKRPDTNNMAKKTFPDFFKVLEDESGAIWKASSDFPVDKEDRYVMERNINLIRESLQRITDAFLTVQRSQYESPGRLDNKMADIVDDLRVDWAVVQSIRDTLPDMYPVDYGMVLEKT